MKRERGEGRVYLRGKTWWLQYGHRGRDYRESSKSTERKVALRLLKGRLAEIHSGRHAPAAERVTLADLRRLLEADHKLNGRRATEQPTYAWGHLEDFFDPHCRAVDLTSARLTAYGASRASDGAAPATFVYELAVLRRGSLVGGAAVIAGLLIGDDAGTAIAIGGAGLGLYGLYVWQR